MQRPKLTQHLWLGVALFAGACNPLSSAPGTTSAGLTASPAAQSYGVGSYALTDHGATLLNAKGDYLGTLFIAPSTDSVSVRVDLADGHWRDNDITRKTDKGYFVSYKNGNILEAVETDPALATLLAGFDLHFTTIDPATSVEAATSPEDIQRCSVPGAKVCRQFGCTTNYDTFTYSTHCVLISDCNQACATYGLNAGGPGNGSCVGKFTTCYCESESLQTISHNSCPRVSCTTAGDCDQFDRERTCSDPGSCSNAGSGFVGCTTQPPTSPNTCSQNGVIYNLSTTIAGGGTGTITSDGSDNNSVNCSSGTCVIGELATTVVNMTATSTNASTFTGWSGACTGTGVCSITMNSNLAVTANFTACVPSCTGKTCGASNGCTAECSGTCSVQGSVCQSTGSGTYACSCVPNCTGKLCAASNGCGGTCSGACAKPGWFCDSNGAGGYYCSAS